MSKKIINIIYIYLHLINSRLSSYPKLRLTYYHHIFLLYSSNHIPYYSNSPFIIYHPFSLQHSHQHISIMPENTPKPQHTNLPNTKTALLYSQQFLSLFKELKSLIKPRLLSSNNPPISHINQNL